MLDDAFPYFARKNRELYVQRPRNGNGCGSPSCNRKNVHLVPFDDWQDHIRLDKGLLENPRSPRKEAVWSPFFCRQLSELGHLPKTVQTKCRRCGAPRLIHRARWTVEKEPRFVIPVQQCNQCNQTKRYFYPVEDLKCINPSFLTKTWKTLLDANFDPQDHLSLRSKVFDRVNLSGIRHVLRTGRNAEARL